MEKTYQPFGLGVGTIINGRYELLQRLGSGANSAVYKVYDRTLSNDTIALKLFSPAIQHDETSVERIYNEALYSRKLTHPNIVRTYELGRTAEGQIFLTMEYVAGSSLEKLIHGPELARPTFSECVRILGQVAQGLAYAHAQGIIHRDIKPANILVGSDGQIKIADFGLARAMYRGHDLTQAGECVGTPYYMAPEQIQDKAVDGRTDVYALGIIAYELATGRVPFHEHSWYDLAQRILNDKLPDFTRSVRVPAWYADFVFRATAKSPDARYESVDEVSTLLQREIEAGVSDDDPIPSAMLPKVLSIVGLRAPATVFSARFATRSRGRRTPIRNTTLLAIGLFCAALVLTGSLFLGRGTEVGQQVNTGTEFLQATGDLVRQVREGAEYAATHREDMHALIQNIAQAVQDSKRGGPGGAPAVGGETDVNGGGKPREPVSNEELLKQLQAIERQLVAQQGESKDRVRPRDPRTVKTVDQEVSTNASSESRQELQEQLDRVTDLKRQLELQLQGNTAGERRNSDSSEKPKGRKPR